MSDTTSREDRIEELERFANAGPEQTYQLPVPSANAAPPMIVHGSQMIAGAKRDLRAVTDEVDAMASTMGDDIFYSIPFKDRKKGTTTFAEGISIDGAMMVHGAYGNAGVHAWVHAEGADHWDIIAIWQDHEKGIEVSRMFRQRKGASRMGGGDSQRNQEAALQIGISKAERNVIANALKHLCNRAYRVAKEDLANKIGKDQNSLQSWRVRIVNRLIANNIPVDRVEAVIGRPAKDWLNLDIIKVIERAKAITEGEALLDETFPPLQAEPDERDVLNLELDKIIPPKNPAHSPVPPEAVASEQGDPSPKAGDGFA